MQGKIIKGIAGFYYVHVEACGIYECKAKGIFRNKKIKPLVGDNVIIDVIDEENKKGNISDILDRKNELIRPASANIDQAMVIFAVKSPEPNYNLLDRFILMMDCQDVPTVVVFNKTDLVESEDIDKLRDIYEKCGCKVIFISAYENKGIDIVMDITQFDKQIADANLIITGEGKSDTQTLMGKVPNGVLKHGKQANIPVWLLSGVIDDPQSILSYHFNLVHSINEGDPRPLSQLLQPNIAKDNLRKTIYNCICRELK